MAASSDKLNADLPPFFAQIPPQIMPLLPPALSVLSFPIITSLSQLIQYKILRVTTANTIPSLIPSLIPSRPPFPSLPSRAVNIVTVCAAASIGHTIHARSLNYLYPSSSRPSKHDINSSLSHYARISLTTLFLFTLTAPSLLSLSPSSYFTPGAFARVSLPATLDYATPSMRARLNTIYRGAGCHTCGTLPSRLTPKSETLAMFNADHIPPISLVNYYNSKWYNRLLQKIPLANLGIMKQVFYPQCKACSSVQGASLMGNSLKSFAHGSTFKIGDAGVNGKLHLTKLRL